MDKFESFVGGIKFILIILLILCLYDEPYWYYMLARLIATGAFGLIAYYEHERGRNLYTLIFAVAVVVFQPLFKIPLGRAWWIVADIVMIVVLARSLYEPDSESKE